MAIEDLESTGIFIARRQPHSAPAPVGASTPVELVGHVKFIERSAPANVDGFRALLSLRDLPGMTVVVIATQTRLQALLESAHTSGKLVACVGTRIAHPPAPSGRARAADVYAVDGVILYSSP
jgi:hypothetical protein